MNATLEKPQATLITELGTTALAQLGERKTILVKMREEFAGLTCDDKEGRDETHAAIMRLTKIRTSTEAEKERLCEGAKDWIKNVRTTAAQIIDTAREIETPLRNMRDEFDAAIEREKQAKIDAERERLAAIERARLAEEAAKVKAEQDRIAEENRIAAEKNRIAAERIEAEARAAQEKADKFRAEMAAAQKKLDDAKAEQEREAAAAKAKADAEAQAERDRIKAEAKAASDKIEAERLAHERHQAAERAKLIEEQRELERQKAEQARIERERQEAIEAAARAEREAKEAAELAERQRVEELAAAQLESERLEALKPDREKLMKWAAKVVKAIESAPDMATEEGCKVRDVTVGKLSDAFTFLRTFCDVK